MCSVFAGVCLVHLARQDVTLGTVHHSYYTVAVAVHTLHGSLRLLNRVVDVEHVIYRIIVGLHATVLVERLIALHISCNVVHPFTITANIMFESHDGVH